MPEMHGLLVPEIMPGTRAVSSLGAVMVEAYDLEIVEYLAGEPPTDMLDPRDYNGGQLRYGHLPNWVLSDRELKSDLDMLFDGSLPPGLFALVDMPENTPYSQLVQQLYQKNPDGSWVYDAHTYMNFLQAQHARQLAHQRVFEATEAPAIREYYDGLVNNAAQKGMLPEALANNLKANASRERLLVDDGVTLGVMRAAGFCTVGEVVLAPDNNTYERRAVFAHERWHLQEQEEIVNGKYCRGVGRAMPDYPELAHIINEGVVSHATEALSQTADITCRLSFSEVHSSEAKLLAYALQSVGIPLSELVMAAFSNESPGDMQDRLEAGISKYALDRMTKYAIKINYPDSTPTNAFVRARVGLHEQACILLANGHVRPRKRAVLPTRA